MLPRLHRLSRENFNSVRRSHFVLSNQIASLRFRSGTHGGAGRFSVVVAGKTVPSAVERNTIRRRTYEIIRPFVQSAGVDGIFYIKQNILNSNEAPRHIQELLTRATRQCVALGNGRPR